MILKVNLTLDSYIVVKMDDSEKSIEENSSCKISEWLVKFGNAGQVHQDDLDYYLSTVNIERLKKYFAEGNSSISM